jgi:hypothetical protein
MSDLYMTSKVADCMVFKLEEVEHHSGSLDNEIFIIYDNRHKHYLIRGKRTSTKRIEFSPYSYHCEEAERLPNFIKYLVCPINKVNEILYNYDNLPENPNDITFDFLKDCEDRSYEISGYNRKKLKKTRLLRVLRMMKDVSNFY